MESFDRHIFDLTVQLFNIGAVKFGNFKTKSGLNSPVYFDLRVIVSHPQVMESICDILMDFAPEQFCCDQICGVPYTALPIATIISIKSKLPMLIRRKEAKSYGTKKLIEGQFKPNDTCLIIEDVVTSGSSILETVNDLRKEGLRVDKAVIILDRQQGGIQNLKQKGIEVTALITMSKLLEILLAVDLITPAISELVCDYLKKSQVSSLVSPINDEDRTKLSFSKRTELAQNPVAKKLFNIMDVKKTNLCLAADVTTTKEILNLLENTGPYICLFKMHIDIVKDFNDGFLDQLTALAVKHNVLLMEDRKYGDIGNTVALQFSGGVHRVGTWADLITVHSLSGVGVVQGIKSIQKEKPIGIFLIGEMSSEGNLITPEYTEATMKMAADEADFIAGIVCQTRGTVKSPGLIQLTPGVQIESSGDTLGQVYNSPEDVILQKDADIAVVGRGIIKAKDPETQAKIYRDMLWECYEKRIKQ